ncbi:MAG: DUF192 domain-containing protein [Myxococcota bacterium]|nr:DUF192 domain-containing protein [Myxococcota bacterium]
MRIMLVFLAAALGGAECERKPSEDFAAQSWIPGAAAASVEPTSSGAGANRGDSIAVTGRCIQPLPVTPPDVRPASPAPKCPSDPEEAATRLPVVRVSMPEGREAAVDAELVRSEHDTSRGLMYRKHMAENRGMLFDLRVRNDHKFWMHNTCIPLDLIYVDEDGLIVGIVENAPALDDGPRGVDCPSLFVLEVNAGWSRRHGVRPGQRIAISGEAREG